MASNSFFRKTLESIPQHTMIFVRKQVAMMKRIDYLLEKKGYKQKDLAQIISKNESEISKWLSGEHNLTLRSLAKLEAALGEEIIQIPAEKEQQKYIGWKKTNLAPFSVHVNAPPLGKLPVEYQPAEKKASAEQQVEVA